MSLFEIINMNNFDFYFSITVTPKYRPFYQMTLPTARQKAPKSQQCYGRARRQVIRP